ncbi:MAG: hypothetical protein QF662_03935, partial [Phycisphaerae bacterium]|nr:hypothetical protein [Phycisphaerae bacterium]
PGDQITFEAEVLDEIKPEGAMTAGTITRGETLIAEIDLMFAHLDKARIEKAGLEDNFVFTEDFMQLLRMRELNDLGSGPSAAPGTNKEAK